MTVRRYPVTFTPAGVTVWVREGVTVIEAARQAGILIPSPCGGRGVCGKCGVRVLEGSVAPPDSTEAAGLKLAPPGVRLACLMRVFGPLTIRPIVTLSTTHVGGSGAEVPEGPYCAGVDLGTTNVEAVILSTDSGRELGRSSVPNEQVGFGADLLTRVSADMSGAHDALTAANRASVRSALEAACGRAGACFSEIARVAIAGNSVMTSSFLGESLAGFGAHPFTSPYAGLVRSPAAELLGDGFPLQTETLTLPPIASFVGGDLTAGLLGAGLLDVEAPVIYIDVGTNAEIAFLRPMQLVVASAPAGPALEGSGISHGGPAAAGGIRTVRWSGGDLELDVIGGGDPAWLTGSGLLTAVATLHRVGHVSDDGLMTVEGPLRSRFGRLGDVLALGLSGAEDPHVWLAQTDVRAFQVAKAAIAAGVEAVLRAAKAKPKAVQRVVLAGALGGAIPPDDLSRIGLVPDELADRVEQIGNASLVGTAMIALDPALLDTALESTAHAEHVQLATDPLFQERFMRHLALQPSRFR